MARSDTDALLAWLATLSYNGIRALESTQPALLVDGRRLRGIELQPGLYIGRDRKCYRLKVDEPTTAVEASPATVLHLMPLDKIQERFIALCRARNRNRRDGVTT